MLNKTREQIDAQRAVDAEVVGLASFETPQLDEQLEALRTWLTQYIVVTDEQLNAVTLWAAHCHAIHAFDTTIYLVFRSVEPQSGKSRCLETLDLVVPNPEKADNVSGAYLARAVEDGITLLLDEVDTVFTKGTSESEQMLRGILNGGYRVTGSYGRMVGQGEAMTRKRFSTFGAKAMAGLKPLPNTLEDRSVVVHMKRKTKSEQTRKFRYKEAIAEGSVLRQGFLVWAADSTVIDRLRDAEPSMPEGLSDRQEDGWTPLFAIAEMAGGEWPSRCWRAAEALAVGIEQESQSTGMNLLVDIRDAFASNGKDEMPTLDMLTHLNGLDESSWGGFNSGKGMSVHELSKYLKPYGIKSKTIRFPSGPLRGYRKSYFTDAWNRYLPDREVSTATSATVDTNPMWKKPETIGPNSLNVADNAQLQPSLNVADVADTDAPQRLEAF
jgi:hypothetical protein